MPGWERSVMRVKEVKIMRTLTLLVTRPSEHKLKGGSNDSRSDQSRRQTILRHGPRLGIIEERDANVKRGKNPAGIFCPERVNVTGDGVGDVIMIALHNLRKCPVEKGHSHQTYARYANPKPFSFLPVKRPGQHVASVLKQKLPIVFRE